jgi:hypothetical protein
LPAEEPALSLSKGPMQLAGSATTHVGTAALGCPDGPGVSGRSAFGPPRTQAVRAREGHGLSRAVKAR